MRKGIRRAWLGWIGVEWPGKGCPRIDRGPQFQFQNISLPLPRSLLWLHAMGGSYLYTAFAGLGGLLFG